MRPRMYQWPSSSTAANRRGPNIRPARPVGFDVAGIVLPEAARPADPRRADHQLADASSHGPPLFIDDVGRHARAGSGEGAGLERQQRIAHHDAAGDLGAAGVVDDRRIDRARPCETATTTDRDSTARRSRRRCAGGRDRGGGVRRRGTRARTRVGEMPRVATACSRRSSTGDRLRVIRRAVVDHDGRAEDRRAEDQPRSHHPAHVGHPVDGQAGVDVGAECHVLRRLDGEAAVRVDDAFGPARRPRGVENDQQVLGIGRLASTQCRIGALAYPAQVIPAEILTVLRRSVPDAS